MAGARIYHERRRIRLGVLLFPWCVGGIEHFIRRLFDHLDRTVYEPFLLFHGRGPATAYFEAAGYPVAVLHRRDGMAVGEAVRWLEEARIDLMMTACYQSIAAEACRLTGIPHIWRPGGKLDIALSHVPMTGRRRVFALLNGLSDEIVVNSRTAAADYQRIGRTVCLIPKGIAFDRRRPVRRDDLRIRHGWSASDPVVAMIAHFTRVKRHADFIEAAALVRRKHPSCRFIIFGRGLDGRGHHDSVAYERSLEEVRIACDLVADLAVVREENDAAGFLDQVDVVVHPCPDESFPNAVLEAMAAGTPVVAAGAGGCAELIEHGRTGLLAAPQRPKQLAGAILEMLAEPHRARALARAARAAVRRRYDIRAVAPRYGAVFERVLRSSRAKSFAAGR